MATPPRPRWSLVYARTGSEYACFEHLELEQDTYLQSRIIEVHSISLQDTSSLQYDIYPSYPTLARAKSKQLQIVPHPRAPNLRPLIHEIASHGKLLIVTIFALDTGGGAGSLQILFVDPETGATKWVEPRFAQVRNAR